MQWGTTPPLRMQGDVTPPLHSGRGSMPPSRAWRLLATIAHIEMEEQCTTTSGLEAARHHHSFGERQHATVESLEGPRHHRPHDAWGGQHATSMDLEARSITVTELAHHHRMLRGAGTSSSQTWSCSRLPPYW